MIGAALSGLVLLVLIFGLMAVANWEKCKDAWHDITSELP